MQQVNVKFDNISQVQQFVNIIEKFEAHFDLGSGQRVVNAKSILGVCALDLSEPLSLSYSSNDDNLIEKIRPFLYRGSMQVNC
ncbi:hypothetical protein C823_002767 [Eubacterium plexicaudatum ASF492]|uniref:HPr domain-containing protein n=1 Tax=Eubacterium plexicaudatum ASF492 TaxID=1235802 RepID=N2AF35_9FIRM|nr:hypothetical protein C823_002767 [Eubacterium plexicaudatum ASF492]